MNIQIIIARIIAFIALFFAFIAPIKAQNADTLRFSLSDVERIFLEKNYALLAQKYSISMAQAAITQARLLPNPNFSFMGNFINPNTGQLLPFGKVSADDVANQVYNKNQVVFQVQQLIYLAKKRSKLVRLAESNSQLQSLAFEDLVRTLRYQLYTTYANLYFDFKGYELLQIEENKQEDLVRAFQALLPQGGVSTYEVTRLEAELQSLRADIIDLKRQISDEQATLRIFLLQKENAIIKPTNFSVNNTTLPSLKLALDSALASRPDLKITFEQATNANLGLNLERARRLPDLTLGLNYESYGNAYRNFVGLYGAIDLPLFNRNQGNIKMAEIRVETSKKAIENQEVIAQSEVANAYQKLQDLYELNANITQIYRDNLQNISTEAIKNYNRKVINLLDYLDKIRTYKQAQINLITLENNIFLQQQYFNYVTNTKFF